MQLPIVPLDTGTSDIGGTAVGIKSLSREQVARLAGFSDDVDAAEAFTIAAGTGVTIEEAAEWRKQVSAPVVSKLLADIGVISGLRAVRKDAAGNR